MAYNNEEFDWDDEIQEDSQFTLLEPGDYDFTVTNFERGVSKAGNKKATLSLDVTDGVRSTKITDDISLLKTAEWKISEFFRSVGLKKHGEKLKMRWNDCVGLSGRCTVSIREYDKKDGSTGKINNIDTYLDPVSTPSTDEVPW